MDVPSLRFVLPAVFAVSCAVGGQDAKEFRYDWTHPRLVVVQLMDDTDHHDELYFESEYLLSRCEKPFEVSAPALFVEDSLTGSGMAFFRQAPLPHARSEVSADWRVVPAAGKVEVLSNAYRCVSIRYDGGKAGRVRAATDFHRMFRPYVAGRDGLFLSNTWGDGNRDARINEPFLMREVEAGAELGVDVIQIDDGWQKGRSANSASRNRKEKGRWGSWWEEEGFWDVDPVRFPNGLGGVVAAARSKGMKFGLWFGPDSSDDAVNWRKDADFLLSLHRSLGIDYFKLDSLHTPGQLALSRQSMLMDRLLDESGDRITIDLDVTAGRRPGYFAFPRIGPVFVENRYIRARDSRLWWPHRTLRNLWSLAHVVDPARLRMEVLNPERLPELYPEDDPLAPMRWPRDAIFAISMFASPLGWFEIQHLSPETVKAWKPLVARWKQERDAIHGGYIYPVGNAPDGLCWTGFVSSSRDGNEGTALLFRELDASEEFAVPVSGYLQPGRFDVSVIGGRGEASVDGGVLKVSVREKLDFVWVKIVRKGQDRGSVAGSHNRILKDELVRRRFDRFNLDDDEIYANAFSNRSAMEAIGRQIPLFECPDEDIERTYYFRWWTFRKHLRRTKDGGWVVTEFLPDVSWAGPENTISCPLGHHMLEGRWIRDPKFLDGHTEFMAKKGTVNGPRAYVCWPARGAWERAKVTGDFSLGERLLPDFVRNYETWERGWARQGGFRTGYDAKLGLFCELRNFEGTEYALSCDGARPMVNSAMWAEADAIARFARLAGDAATAERFAAAAKALDANVSAKLWNGGKAFFTALAVDGRRDDVCELHGYAPFYFGMPAARGRGAAWPRLLSESGFMAPAGLTFPARDTPGFNVEVDFSKHECLWNGPSWPYATSVALTGLYRSLQGGETAISSEDFARLLHQYAAQQMITLEDGRRVPWIDEDLHPFTGEWLARRIMQEQTRSGGKKHLRERGKDYNHSTFCDLVIAGLCGFVPQEDGSVVVKPLAPKSWDWWCVDGIRYHGYHVTVLFDRDGLRYGKGCGLVVLKD